MNRMIKKQKEIVVIFRYDDVSTLTPLGLEKKIIETFFSHGICFTMGVIPYVTKGDYYDQECKQKLKLTNEKIEMLKKAALENHIEVALHGYNHRTRFVNSESGSHSEFQGMAYEEQAAKVKEGKAFLEKNVETRVVTFIPPWNTYDTNTLRALIAEGIRNISANRYGPVLQAGDEVALQYIPVTIELHNIRKAVSKARMGPGANAAIVVLLHPYDFKESGDARGRLSLNNLREVLALLRSGPDIVLVSVAQAGKTGKYGFRRFEANRPSSLEEIFPPFIKTTYHELLYTSQENAAKRKMLKSVLTFVSIAFVILVGGITGRLLGNWLLEDRHDFLNIWHAAGFGTITLVFCVVGTLKLSFKRFATAVLMMGVFAGVFIEMKF